MSHYAIVELQPYKIEKSEWVEQDELINDIGIQYHTDYVGDLYSKEERKHFIENELPELFKGIATVNPAKETITFLSREEIKETMKNEINEAVSYIQREIDMGYDLFFNFRHIGRWFRQNCTIIWSELSSYTSAQFIEDARFRAGETMHIGAIYDYYV